MKLLAIDTATEACSAAIAVNGEIHERYELAPRRHAELILPMVDQLLAEAELQLADMDALVFGRGPGAFTGVRVAAGVIQGLAFAADLPVIPVSTLAALAQGAVAISPAVLSAIDARMGEIYWGCFKTGVDNIMDPVIAEAVAKPETIIPPEGNDWLGIGSGWQTYHEILSTRLQDKLIGFEGECYPHARDMITLAIREFNRGNTVSADKAIPVYLRDQVTG